MGAYAEQHQFDRIGGRVSLDFVNTMSGRRPDRLNERLQEYADLVFWAQQAGLVDAGGARRLIAQARLHPRRAALALEEAIADREALHDVVLAAVQGRSAPDAQLARVNGFIASALQRRRLRPIGPGRFEATFDGDESDLLGFLRPVAADAADLLAADLSGGRLHVCESETCGWLFVDQTRNHSRRWCSMRDCGNRAKQRRHYQRRKSQRKR